MKPVARLFIRLYPAQWRARYGEEFEALIEDSSPGGGGTLDLLKGAIMMHMHVPAFPKLAVILMVTGLAAGFAMSWLMTPVYISSVELELSAALAEPSDAGPDLRERIIQIEQQALSRTSLSMVIQDPRLDLYKSERARMPLDDVIDSMRRDILIRLQPRSEGRVPFVIQFRYRDPVKARDTLLTLVTKFVDANLRQAINGQRTQAHDRLDRLEARLAELEGRMGIASPPAGQSDEPTAARGGEILYVVDVPSLPAHAWRPNRTIFAASGCGAGFAVALVIAVFRRKPPAIPFPAQAA